MSISSVSADRSLFLGPRIPTHLKSLHKLLSQIDRSLFRRLLKLAVLDLERKSIQLEAYHSIKKTNDNCDIDIIYGGLYFLLTAALHFPQGDLKQEIFKEDLRELKIQEDYIEDLNNVIFGPRCFALTENMKASIPRLLKLDVLQWRVDVAISISSLNRILEPSLLMEIELSDGRKDMFEVSPSQFHKFRFAVATLLKEIESLEKKNIFKS